MSPRQLVRGLTICLISSLGMAGCGGSHSTARSAVSPEFQGYTSQTEQAQTTKEPAPSVEEPAPAIEESDESTLTKRALTADEKKSLVAAYKLEEKKAVAEIRNKKLSEDELTRDIHKRELAKIAAQLTERTRVLSAAKKAKTMAAKEVEHELTAAKAAAKLARAESTRTKDHALKAAAGAEEKALAAAKAMFKENCKALDHTTVADFGASDAN